MLSPSITYFWRWSYNHRGVGGFKSDHSPVILRCFLGRRSAFNGNRNWVWNEMSWNPRCDAVRCGAGTLDVWWTRWKSHGESLEKESTHVGFSWRFPHVSLQQGNLFFSLLWNIGIRSDEASIFMGLGMAAEPRKLETSATEDGKFSNKKWGLDVQDPGSWCYRCLVPQVEKLRKENKAIKEKVRTGLQARNYCLAFRSRARGFVCAHFLNAMCFW